MNPGLRNTLTDFARKRQPGAADAAKMMVEDQDEKYSRSEQRSSKSVSPQKAGGGEPTDHSLVQAI